MIFTTAGTGGEESPVDLTPSEKDNGPMGKISEITKRSAFYGSRHSRMSRFFRWKICGRPQSAMTSDLVEVDMKKKKVQIEQKTTTDAVVNR
ncbi:hypothetical protein BGZ63DRAFT_370921 [Mariannaea sp. PMI_226]|nr:hypothetical protein BGZ63DRAFT_370921 [Mariannaea sp. PMI_226]